ncbi:lytic transglycosylase domain-containing protein [Nitratireductor sp. ZSWI3]|uniref:lytic transglycosylase domain-containing protein n=1 Tax=Nitratireductor sp. ZSWI3 TaxID=2966359 RepID=UPI00214F83F7|nr:lytic transglycosylase domain-containing protein [Nitratireductor sp. ZSWI3]MCR4269361.1 lytic transglycosylase domain-containing protein [Nitratireductor sp. ZSWI3]
MRSPVISALKTLIPLFAGRPSHLVVPLGHRTAGARSEGQGRPSAGASRAPLTAASTLTGWRHSGGGLAPRYAVLLLAGVLALCSGPTAAVAQSAPIASSVSADPYGAHIAEASQRFGVPERWIRAVLRAESAGDVRAISSAGAMGLMQVMPDTWEGLRVRYRLGRDPYEPRDNIMAGAAYLREMWDRYGNVAAMLAAYNAGPGRYDEYLATGRVLPAETHAYVAALVPALGGAAASEVATTVPPPPPDWRAAPLFVARSGDTETAAMPSSEVQSGHAHTTISVRDLADVEPQGGSIFVARADDGGTP